MDTATLNHEIRPAQPADVDAIFEVLKQCEFPKSAIKDTTRTSHYSKEYIRKFMKGNPLFHVALVRGQIVGCNIAFTRQFLKGVFHPETQIISYILGNHQTCIYNEITAVLKEHEQVKFEGKSLAEYLLQEVQTMALSNGIPIYDAVAMNPQDEASIRFLTSQGFKLLETVTFGSVDWGVYWKNVK